MHQTAKLRRRAWLALPIQVPQAQQAGATWLCKNKPCSSTNLHISPEISKVATASALEKISEDLSYVLIHISGQSGLEEPNILPIIPQSKKQSDKCSMLQFKQQLPSP